MRTLYEISKTKKVTAWKKLADAWFSRFIRIVNSDENEMVECVSCGKKIPVKQIQCGHFASRRHLSTRYLEENCYPQCYGCNCGQNGNYAAFAAKIIKDHGKEMINFLNKKSGETKRMDVVDYCELIGKYSAMATDTAEIKEIKVWWNITKVEKELIELTKINSGVNPPERAREVQSPASRLK